MELGMTSKVTVNSLSLVKGPMKVVIPTPDIAKIFHPTLRAKNACHPTFKIYPDT